MEVNKINTSINNISNENKEGFVNINEAVNSLTKAVSVLESINQTGQETSANNFEETFPDGGLDFYQATKHYEISLIKKALKVTRGHQTNAAKLLNLKLSTLNSIIKRYNISF